MKLLEFTSPVWFLDVFDTAPRWRRVSFNFNFYYPHHSNEPKFTFGGTIVRDKYGRHVQDLLQDTAFVGAMDVFLHTVVMHHLGYEHNPHFLFRAGSYGMSDDGKKSPSFHYTLPTDVSVQLQDISAHKRFVIEQTFQNFCDAQLARKKKSS